MVRQTNLLFNAKTIKRLCQDVAITDKQSEAAKEWLKLLDENKLEDEKKNYFRFGQIILQEILGYPIKEVDFESDNVEFQFANSEGKKMLCFEAKGTSTKDLFSPQHRQKKEHETPIKQTGDYMMSIGLDYGICTNYKDFVLITKEIGYSKYHKFDFVSIRNDEEKLKEFVGVFSKERLIDKSFAKKLYHESIIEEREFTKEFYKLFHETRLMLIKTFQEHPDVTKDEAIRYAQLYLNRIIFMFFSEDNGLIYNRLFSTRIQEALKSPLISEHSKSISDEILSLFSALNKGSNILGIYGFNGGLFDEIIPPKIYFTDLQDPKSFSDIRQNWKLSKESKLDDFSAKIVKKYSGQLNPIITNLLIMDLFDFTSEVNVNILGHIFEQSISDLEELRGDGVSKRKKEGVYYTPEYITDYICRNTIIPYLSKSNVTTVTELVKEYAKNIEELEKKIKEIKILDPACGSGAFLVKAAEILLEIDEEIQNQKHRASDFQITEFSEEKEITKIIQDNIFGVDINEESVEITKLSLFLKTATTNHKLTNLSNNIKVGNSIIDDPQIADKKAFDWRKEFPNIINNGGFSVIIGNPPYVRQERLTPLKPYFEKNYQSYAGTADLYVYFLEKGMINLKDDGYFGVIVSNKWSKATYGENLRKFLIKFKILRFIDFGDLPVFSDATTYPCILLIKKITPENNNILVSKIDSLDFTNFEKKVIEYEFGLKQTYLTDGTWDFDNPNVKQIYIKIKSVGIQLEKYCKEKINRGLLTGLDEVFVIDEAKKNELEKKSSTSKELIKPYLIGKQIKRYAYDWENKYIILVKKGTDIERYPAIFNYLKQFEKELTARWDKGDWFSLRECSFYDDFLKPKIIYAHFAKRPQFTFDTNNFHLNAKSYILPTDDKYLLGILNSSVIALYSQSICPYVRGEFYEYNKQYVNQFPIPKASDPIREKISKMVDQLLELHSQLLEKKKTVSHRIKSEFGIENISMKLYRFHTMSSNDFLLEIKRLNKKSEIPLTKLDEWDKYFYKYKDEIVNLETKIKNIDKEIDQIVYDLFGINPDERKIIENELQPIRSNSID